MFVEVNATFKLYKGEVDVGLSGHGDEILIFTGWTTTKDSDYSLRGMGNRNG
jgi:hypothetical protein